MILTRFFRLLCYFLLLNPHSILFSETWSSRLPIIIIHTQGQEIRDEPKTIMHMGIIDNGNGEINYSTDPYNHYDGKIAIEIRGSTSQEFLKKSYGFETLDEDENEQNVSLLDMPKENDWILYGPYSDKSLIRNVLSYRLSNDMGLYAPRTRFCELQIDSVYKGIYVLIEKIKRDEKRVNIKIPCDSNYSGGYLMELTFFNKLDPDDRYFVTPCSNRPVIIRYPKIQNITTEQFQYINDYIYRFENALYRESVEEAKELINQNTFIDYMLLNEALRNNDVFFSSTYFYKDRDSLLCMGPLWDMNISMGNVNYNNNWKTDGYWLPECIWSEKLLEDLVFYRRYQERWTELREEILSTQRVLDLIDIYVSKIDTSLERNFQAWPVLGTYVWPNYFIGETYDDEIVYLKNWILQRFEWLDIHLPTPIDHAPVSGRDYHLLNVYPNPFNGQVTIDFTILRGGRVTIYISDICGRIVETLMYHNLSPGQHSVAWDGAERISMSSGVFVYHLLHECKRIGKGKLVYLK